MQAGKWGFIARDGKVVIPPQFEAALENFQPGESGAPARLRGKWGFITRDARFVLEPQFDAAMWFTEGMAAVNSGGAWIEKAGPRGRGVGTWLITGLDEKLRGLSGGKWGYVNSAGQLVAPPRYELATQMFRFHDGVARVIANGKWQYIDTQGRLVVDTGISYSASIEVGFKSSGPQSMAMSGARQMGIVGDFSEGLASVPFKAEGKFGYIDRAGKPPIVTQLVLRRLE